MREHKRRDPVAVNDTINYNTFNQQETRKEKKTILDFLIKELVGFVFNCPLADASSCLEQGILLLIYYDLILTML